MIIKYLSERKPNTKYGFLNLQRASSIHFYPEECTLHFSFGESQTDRKWILYIDPSKFADVQDLLEEILRDGHSMLDISDWVEGFEIVEDVN